MTQGRAVQVALISSIAALFVTALIQTKRADRDPLSTIRPFATRERCGYIQSIEGKYFVRTLTIEGKSRKEVIVLAEPKILASGYVGFDPAGAYKRSGSHDWDCIMIDDSKFEDEKVVMVGLMRTANNLEWALSERRLSLVPLLTEDQASRHLFGQD